MVSSLAGEGVPQPGVEPGTQLGALAEFAAQAHRQLCADRQRLNQVAGLLRPMVLESWLRSSACGVEPNANSDGRGLRDADLQRYRDSHPIAAVMPLVDRLLLQDATNSGLVVVVADHFGRALSVHGSCDQLVWAAAAGLREGEDLGERRIGTGAVGLVLRTGRATWVHGPEHFLQRMHGVTEAAAPVHDPGGRLVGVLMIAGGERVARPEILALVKAAATAAEMELLLNTMRAQRVDGAEATGRASVARLRLEVLGQGQPQLIRSGEPIALSQRHAEILLLLAEYPEGLSADHLALLLDHGELDNTTIRAAMSRLRSVVGANVFGSRPYRLQERLATDVEGLRRALDVGAVQSAVLRYTGPVLPRSTAPGVMDIRDELRGRLRAAVLRSGDPEVLERWTAGADGRDDPAAWSAYRVAVDRDSPLYTQIEAKIRLLDRRLSTGALRR